MDEIKKFAIFLETMRIVSENKIPYYCVWVRKFIRLEWKNQELSDHDKLMLWSDSVARYRNLEDWQIDQAEEAIKIFLDWRVGKNSAIELRTENHSSSLMMAEEMVKKTRELIRLRHYSYRTEGTYLSWIERYIRYGRDQQAMLRLPATLKAFLTYLAVERKVSKSTQSQAFNALLFLFREVLKIDVSDMGKVVRSKRSPKLPVVLTVDETRRLFRHTSGTSQLMLKIIYGGGLRVSELTRLRVQDIDFQQNLIHVRVSKGDVDRATLLAVSVRDSLTEQLGRVKQIYADDISRGFGEAYLPEAMARKYSKAAREWHWQYIFPSKNLSVDPRSGKILRHHISDKAVQGAMSSAVKRAKIEKQATVHSLRHSFATHMLMRGVNIRQIQEYLGHKNVETTMIYTHVIRGMSNDPQSPLDLLDLLQNSVRS